MIKKFNSIFSLLLLLACYTAHGQMAQYDFSRELSGINDQWHKIILPDEIFGKVSNDFNDIRIYGIKQNNDTIEVPYLIRISSEQISEKDVQFKLLNESHNTNGYFFTFEIPTNEPINQIRLDFSKTNFDWQIKLEGSHDQDEWFTILENYRILSIKNNETDFQFTKLTFPGSNYRFFRLTIPAKENPGLKVASISQQEIKEGSLKNYTVTQFTTVENKKDKQTEIEIELKQPVPIGRIKINVKNAFDYYRPVTIKYLADSFKTEQGWKYNYVTVVSGTLNSIEKNEFRIAGTITNKLKIIIHNQDNTPLEIADVQVMGYTHELTARFNEEAKYFLVYGNKKAFAPQYDIERFSDKIPETTAALNLGSEKVIDKERVAAITPLFTNKNWLWVIMGVIILLLGWFSVKMIGKNS